MKSLISALAILAATPALAQDQMTLLLDWYVNPDHGPIIVAQENGYFADEGLEVEIIPPADASTPSKLVAAGRADLAVSYQQQLHLQVHEGLPLLRVGTLVGTPLNCLMSLADGPINSVADLKGRKVGFSVAGVEEALLKTMLARYDLTLDDIELVNVNFALTQSLMSEQVDAVIGAYRNIELNMMAVEGIAGQCTFIEEEGVPAYDELIYVANADTLDKDKIARFLSAVERSTHEIVNTPEATWQVFAATSTELQDEANELSWMDTISRFSLSPAALDYGRYKRFEQYMFDAGLVEEVLPVERLAIDVNR